MALVSGRLTGVSASTNINIRLSVDPWTVLYTTTTDASGNWSKVLPAGTYLFCAQSKKWTSLVVATSIPKTGVVLTKTAIDEPVPLAEPEEVRLPQHKPGQHPPAFRELAIYLRTGEINRRNLRSTLKRTPFISWSDACATDTYHETEPVEEDANVWYVVLFWDEAGAAPDLEGFDRVRNLATKPGKKSAPKKSAPKKK